MRWFASAKFALLCVVALCLISACGFHLRGGGVDSILQRVHLSSERGVQLLVPLRQRLSGLGISLVKESARPEVLVHLLANNFNRRTISVTGRVLAAEYELTMSVRYQISRGDTADSLPGQQPKAPQERLLEVSRIYAIDQGNLVGSSEEQALLMFEMREDLVQQIIRNMNTLANP